MGIAFVVECIVIKMVFIIALTLQTGGGNCLQIIVSVCINIIQSRRFGAELRSAEWHLENKQKYTTRAHHLSLSLTVMAETATVGLNQRDETTLRRHTLECRINGTYIEPLMTGPWKSMTEFEFEGNTCLLPEARVSAETLNFWRRFQSSLSITPTYLLPVLRNQVYILELVVYIILGALLYLR